jgi:prevent-host-death family protein
MITMSSLEAQNQFGALIDSSLREPVVITRRGRPVSVVISCEDLQSLPFSVVKAISELKPLRGPAASVAMAKTLANLNPATVADPLNEADVTRLVRELR